MPHAHNPLPKGDVFSGARARFSIGGVIIGFATNCSGSEEVVYEPVQVLDHIQTVQFVPVGYNVTFTASRVRLMRPDVHGSLRNGGFFPKHGQNDAEFLHNILNQGDLNCQIEDTISNSIFMLLTDVRVASHNWAITPRGLVGEDVNFLGITMRDESEA